MKKTLNILIICILAITLSSCSLAQDDDFYNSNKDSMGEEDYYVPSGFEFTLYHRSDFNNKIDASEFFYVNLACNDQTVFDNCLGASIGKSMESAGTHYHTEHSTIDGVEQAEVNTVTLDLTLYSRKDTDYNIGQVLIKENSLGDRIRQDMTFVDFESGLSISGSYDGQMMNGTTYIVNYEFTYVTIDDLGLVTIRQFDKSDNLLLETSITKENLLEELFLEEDTEYYFVVEQFIDEDGTEYTEREYHHHSETTMYLYKYTNSLGFLLGDRVMIYKESNLPENN